MVVFCSKGCFLTVTQFLNDGVRGSWKCKLACLYRQMGIETQSFLFYLDRYILPKRFWHSVEVAEVANVFVLVWKEVCTCETLPIFK